MIKQPEQMDFSNKKFTMIIAGSPGLGKTTLALSAPNPLLFDFDNGISRVKAEHRRVTSVVDSYQEFLNDLNTREYKEAESIVIDTGGSLVQTMQPWAQKQEPKAARDGRAMFGVIKREFSRLCHQIKNLDGKNLIYVFHTTEVQKGDVITQRLSCEGSAKDIVWTPADLGAYMYMSGKDRVIAFTPTDEYFAKGCYGISGLKTVKELRPGEPNTFLADLFQEARASITQETEAYAPQRKAYEEAMERGHEIIAAVANMEQLLAALEALGGLAHSLTSKRELVTMLNSRATDIGAVWNKEKKQYEQVQSNGKSA